MLETLRLDDIDISRLRLVKQVVRFNRGQDHSRWIFLSPADRGPRLICKLWNESYVRRDNILCAVERGLYNPRTTPALRALVMHRGAVRGYLMDRCARPRSVDPEFVAGVWEATRASGMFACQYRRAHVMAKGEAQTLIDLEAAFPVSGLLSRRQSIPPIEDARYARLVETLAVRDSSPEDVRILALRSLEPEDGRPSRDARSALRWIARKASGMRIRVDRLTRNLRPDDRHRIDLRQ